MSAVDRLTSRKWLLVLLVVVVAVLARWQAWIDGAQLVGLLQWVVGLYMVGNVGAVAAGSLNITAAKAEGKSEVA